MPSACAEERGAEDDARDDEAEGERRHGQVVAAQPQDRHADHQRPRAAVTSDRRGQGEPRREAEQLGRRGSPHGRGEHRGRVAADGEEARVAQGDLAGVAHEEAQAEGRPGCSRRPW